MSSFEKIIQVCAKDYVERKYKMREEAAQIFVNMGAHLNDLVWEEWQGSNRNFLTWRAKGLAYEFIEVWDEGQVKLTAETYQFTNIREPA